MEYPRGATFNPDPLRLWAMYGITAWTYYKKDPRELAKELDAQEKALKERGKVKQRLSQVVR